ETGKMDKRKDLSEFNKGQMVMARRLDQSISKTAALVGCSRSAVSAQVEEWKTATSIYDFTATDIDGNEVSLEKYKGQMHAKYAERGLSILAFPCNQFGNQEPGTHKQIKQYAQSYNVQFDLFSKINVNGPEAHVLWKWLKEQPNGEGLLGKSMAPVEIGLLLVEEVEEGGECADRERRGKVGCELEEKERIWSELDEVMESIPTGERVVIGADFNGHVGKGNRGDEEVMGKFGVKGRNLEGQMVVDFAKRMDMAVVKNYFQKREELRVTYKSGGQTEEFKVEVGLHQGSALSPFLFAMVMDQLSEEVRQESPWTMMFADDIVICSESREQVEENLERWRFALERRGMKFLIDRQGQVVKRYSPLKDPIEPGTNEQIKQYAKTFNVQFDIFSKIDVNGQKAHPLWKWLKEQPNGEGFLGK
ncbi:hypothetical protein QTP86_019049, partial [Hemibagrus guttatus]